MLLVFDITWQSSLWNVKTNDELTIKTTCNYTITRIVSCRQAAGNSRCSRCQYHGRSSEKV